MCLRFYSKAKENEPKSDLKRLWVSNRSLLGMSGGLFISDGEKLFLRNQSQWTTYASSIDRKSSKVYLNSSSLHFYG